MREIIILNMQLDVGVWFRLKLSNISEEPLLEGVRHADVGRWQTEKFGLRFSAEAVKDVCTEESVWLQRECGVVDGA
jgi:hypothetical protein